MPVSAPALSNPFAPSTPVQPDPEIRGLVDRPIIVIGCSRSGTTLLFQNLAEHPLTWSNYEECFDIFYRHYPIHPDLGERVAEPPTPQVGRAIAKALYRIAHNKEQFRDTALLRHVPLKLIQRPFNLFYKRPPVRLVEKTPANSLRVPMLAALFPDAKFVFLVRRAEAVISSLMEGWKNWSDVKPGQEWRYDKWHYLSPPGWREWTGRRLEEICAFQWVESTRIAWEDLERHVPGRYLMVRHEDALAHPRAEYERILRFCELPASPYFDRLLAAAERRTFTHGGSRPSAGKWKKLHGPEIERVRPMFEALNAELYPGKA